MGLTKHWIWLKKNILPGFLDIPVKRLTTVTWASIRQDKQKWADDLASEAEADLTAGRMKDAFSNLCCLRSAGPRISSPISLAVSWRHPGIWPSPKTSEVEGPLLRHRHHAALLVDLVEEAANIQPDESVSSDPPCSAWTTNHISDDWHRGLILPFYKGRVADMTVAITVVSHCYQSPAKCLFTFFCLGPWMTVLLSLSPVEQLTPHRVELSKV